MEYYHKEIDCISSNPARIANHLRLLSLRVCVIIVPNANMVSFTSRVALSRYYLTDRHENISYICSVIALRLICPNFIGIK